jgi:thermitase
LYSKAYLLTNGLLLALMVFLMGCSGPSDFLSNSGSRDTQAAVDKQVISSEEAKIAAIESMRIEDRVLSSEISVKFTKGITDDERTRLLSKYDLEIVSSIPELGFYRLKLEKGVNLTAKLSQLWKESQVEVAEPIFRTYARQLRVRPNDPRFTEQAYLDIIKAPEAWFIEPGSDLAAIPSESDVVVAVLDSGLDMNHPDLMVSIGDFDGAKILNGWNFVDGNLDVMDHHGHGTLVTGIIGALTSNAVGIAGLAWNPRIMPIRVLDENGVGDSFRSAEAIMFALGRFNDLRGEDQNFTFPLQTIFNDPFNAKMVINMSYGYTIPDTIGESQAEASAIDTCMNSQHVMLVAAAGDDGVPIDDGFNSVYPANNRDVIPVGAIDTANNPLATSNRPSTMFPLDSRPFLVAPGYNILSTFPVEFSEGYAVGNGTSFAAAQVSGLIGLIWSQFPYLRPDEVLDVLKESSNFDIVGGQGIDAITGWGLIDCFAALQRSYQPKPVNEPVIVTAFTNPILHSDIIFVIRSKYRLMDPVETPYYIDEATGFPVLINNGMSISYTVGYDNDDDGVIDDEFPIVETSLYGEVMYFPNELTFVQFSDDLYVGRVHFTQDAPPQEGTYIIQFTGVPANFMDNDEIPRTVSGETSIQITGFHYS